MGLFFCSTKTDSTVQAQANAHFKSSTLDVAGLERSLASMDPAQKLAWVRSLGRRAQRDLFEACAGRAVKLTDIVPASHPAMTEVICEGKNTLPTFKLFQKRFCQASPDDGVLYGYNHQTMTPFTGPGYFVTVDDPATGEAVIDYRRLPDRKPEGWPAIIPNENRLGIFVYSGMVDRLRRVTPDIFIGRAFRGDKPMNAWFTLYRTLPLAA
jgi:hypothetical protein